MTSTPRRKLSSVDSAQSALHVALDHLTEEFLECRDMRHRWYVSSDYRRVSTEEVGIRPRKGHSDYVERRLTCERCGTDRVEAYLIVRDRSYTMLRSLGASYHHPDGYLLHGLPPGVSSAGELTRGLRFERAEAERTAAPVKRRPTKTARSSA